MYLDQNLGLRLSLSEITLRFDLSLYLDRTLAQRKSKSKDKVAKYSSFHLLVLLVWLASIWVNTENHKMY